MDTTISRLQRMQPAPTGRTAIRPQRMAARVAAPARALWQIVRTLAGLFADSSATAHVERQRHTRHSLTYHGMPGA